MLNHGRNVEAARGYHDMKIRRRTNAPTIYDFLHLDGYHKTNAPRSEIRKQS